MVFVIVAVVLFVQGHSDARVIDTIPARAGLDSDLAVDYTATFVSGPWIAASVVCGTIAAYYALIAVRSYPRGVH